MDLDLNLPQINDYHEYKKVWNEFKQIKVECVEKYEECKHNIGDVYYYANPYDKPNELCSALKHVIDLYIWRVELGFPSWNQNNSKIFRIHCPDSKGSVWELSKSN